MRQFVIGGSLPGLDHSSAGQRQPTEECTASYPANLVHRFTGFAELLFNRRRCLTGRNVFTKELDCDLT
jgi:hypothetical protein